MRHSLLGGLFLTACATAPNPSPGLGRTTLAGVDEIATPVAAAPQPAAAAVAAPGHGEPQQDPNAGRPRTKMPNNWPSVRQRKRFSSGVSSRGGSGASRA